MAAPDTIVAIATAPGEAAVAITRLSGPDALALAARFFRGARSPLTAGSHRILVGNFVDGGGASIDTVLLSVFRAPHSYTGDDVVEVSCHGGPAVPRAILETLTAAGARPARPGEFTERAYRNGKLDLAQAEAVASLVRARSERALHAAHATLDGELSRRVAALDAELVSLLAEVESRLDFPGDVRESADVAALAARCAAAASPVRDWLERLPSARRREEGVRVAIVGAPNVGKSSLLNALVGYDRAIVSAMPGTTRDTVEASIWLDGVELRLADTAGLRDTADPVERLGVERSARAAAAADLTLVVRDASRPEAVAASGASSSEGGVRRGPTIEVWNKADLAPAVGWTAAPSPARAAAPSPTPAVAVEAAGALATVSTVAIRPGGVEPLVLALRAAIPALVGGGIGAAAREEWPATSLRQEGHLREAREALARAVTGLRADAVAYDLVAVDLGDARRALGDVIGRGADDAVIAEVFRRFCIGK